MPLFRSDMNGRQIPIGFFHPSHFDLENQALQEEAAKEPLLSQLKIFD